MPIISTTVTVDQHAQASGSRYVVERHVDSLGREHQYLYLAADGFDTAAQAVTRSAALDVQLADNEAVALLGG